jgi:FkbM family methyltransferase
MVDEIEWCDTAQYGRICGLASDETVFGLAKRGGLWEPELVVLFERLIRPGSIAIDAGANIGLHTIAMVVQQPKLGAVYSFEPHPSIFPCLKENAARDHRIRPCNQAVGRRAGTAAMVKLGNSTNPGGARLFEGVADYSVDVVSLDSLRMTNVSFIKADVEGYEHDLILGAQDLIRRERPALIIEIATNERREEKVSLVCGMGYRAEPLNAWDVLFTPI